MDRNVINPKILKLYDTYCHSDMSRREFLSQAAATNVVGGLSGYTMASLLLPDYAQAQEVLFTDDRITPEYVTYKSPGGVSGNMKGYLVRPKGEGPFPAVLVVHENRGLNPYIEDVARRLAVSGFLALAPDALSPVGGYPGNDEEGKLMQAKLDGDKILIDMKNSAHFLKKHSLSNGNLGVTGFCFGGAVANHLATTMGEDLQAAVPFYGRAPKTELVKDIKAKMLIHYAETDDNVNASREEYRQALKQHKIDFEMFSYKGTNHGFHNYSTPRYDKDAAKQAWDRTIDFFKKELVKK